MEFKNITIYNKNDESPRPNPNKELAESFKGLPIFLKKIEENDYKEVIGFIDNAFYDKDVNGILANIWIRDFLFQEGDEEYICDEVVFQVDSNNNYFPIALKISKENKENEKN